MNKVKALSDENNQDIDELEILKFKSKSSVSEKKESKKNNSESEEINSQNDEEIVKCNDNKVLKRKVTDDGVVIDRILSEGETSSGFETVSSVDSNVDIDDLDLSSSVDEDDYNIIVKVKNELAFQNKYRPCDKIYYQETRNYNSVWHNQDCFLNEYTHQMHKSPGHLRESKYRLKNNVDKNSNYDRRDRKSSERKNFDHSRQKAYSKEWSINRDQVRGTRRSRFDDYESGSRRSGSYECYGTDRFRSSRSPQRVVRSRSPNYKDRKTESRYSRSFDKSSTKSSPERSSPPRKKRCDSPRKSSSSSVWNRPGNQKSPNRVRKEERNNDRKSQGSSLDSQSKKKEWKERTPFIVELERKLQTRERSKNNQLELNKSSESVKHSKSDLSLMPTSAPATNESYELSLGLMQMASDLNFQNVYPRPYSPMPAVSVNNLPLVPGLTGLPVHILANGEHIPHDIDGRPIPVGPNGYYLPTDPTGRIFPHFISRNNEAVPIHMTEDGVLRLPNSEPVPFGPGHQFPVNIDGTYIPIGPDSKPLYPCPDLLNRTPNLLQKMESTRGDQVAGGMPCLPPQLMGKQETVQTRAIETQTENEMNVQPSADLNLSQNHSEEINTSKLLKKFKNKAHDKNEDVFKLKEMKKNLDFNHGGSPMRLSQQKFSRIDICNSCPDIILCSDDSNSSSNSVMELKVSGPNEEILLNSDDEQGVLEIICDKKVPEETKAGGCISEKVVRALKFLNKIDYKSPKIGRFIVSNIYLTASAQNSHSPNESPLFRKRIQLSFITPNIPIPDQRFTIKEPEVKFKFLSQEKDVQKEQTRVEQKVSNVEQNVPNDEHKAPEVEEISDEKKPTKVPVITFDFAMQCDFTSETIKDLRIKVSKLEMEINRLRCLNANLFDDFRKIQIAKEKEAEELKKAKSEIQVKNNEIHLLKHLLETK